AIVYACFQKSLLVNWGSFGGLSMAKRPHHKLSASFVAKLTKPGKYADGGGLYLNVKKPGSRNWILIYMRQGRSHEAGLGSCLDVSLADARQKASEFRALLGKDIDPIEHRKLLRKSAIPQKTFAQCAEALIKDKRPGWRSAFHATQWVVTLGKPCAAIRKLPVDEITTEDVLQVLRPIWHKTPTTAERILYRIAAVLDY